VIVPVKRALAPRLSVEIHSAMLGHQADRYLKPTHILAGLLALVLLVLLPEHTPASVAPLLVGFAGTVGGRDHVPLL
jgi:hypothetical protein